MWRESGICWAAAACGREAGQVTTEPFGLLLHAPHLSPPLSTRQLKHCPKCTLGNVLPVLSLLLRKSKQRVIVPNPGTFLHWIPYNSENGS